MRRQRSDAKPLPINGRKVCTRCGIDQPLAFFSRNRKARDGYQVWCKTCQSAWYAAKWTAVRQQQREAHAAKQLAKHQEEEVS